MLEASSRLEAAERDLSTLELEAQELQAKRTALAQHAVFRAKQASIGAQRELQCTAISISIHDICVVHVIWYSIMIHSSR